MPHAVGLVTIGQSPRVDVVPDLLPLLAGARILERGALDDLDAAAIADLAPTPDSRVLVSRLRDGGSAKLDEDRMLPLVQAAVDRVVADGAGAVLLLCTGHLPGLHAPVPLYTAEALAHGGVAALVGDGRLAVVNPEPEQLAPSAERWAARLGRPVVTVAADPYAAGADGSGSGSGDPGGFERAARELREAGAEWAFLDCIGYSEHMRRRLERLSGARVLLARSLAARLLMEALPRSG